MNFIKNNYRYFISPLIVLILLIIVFILNQVYPFGSSTISNGDMGKAYTPIYYYMWDVFHGNANFFINFKVGMGTNMYDLISIYGIFSPFSWIISLTERSNIPNFMSYLLIMKVCCISITSFILFDKCYKNLDLFWKIFFSVIYAFSGWVIVYHTNFVWLDNVILFPLLILGMKKIVVEGDYRLYSIILFLSLSLSYYISYMEILFVIFAFFGYLIFLSNKDERKKIIFNLGMGTMFSMGGSLVFWGPVVAQSFSSIRYNLVQEVLLFSATVDKLMIVIFYAFPIILFILLLGSRKIEEKYKKFALYMFFIMCIGVIFDPVNAMWHTGSYAAFPFRYGFIVMMVIYLGALFYLNINSKLKFNFSKVSFCSISLLFGILIYFFIKYVPVSKSSSPSLYLDSKMLIFYVLAILMISILLVMYLLWIKNLKVKLVLISIFIIISIIGFSLGYVGIYSNKMLSENTDVSLFKANNLYEFLENDNNDFNRYKNFNNDLISNYSFISDKSSISSWHMVDSNSFNILRDLGYYTHFTEIRENGGTLFSDNLLGINEYINSKKLDERIYKLVKNNGNYNLYELNSYLGYGFIYDGNKNIDDYDNSIDFQNNIYKTLFDKNDKILEEVIIDINNKICSSVKNKEVVFELEFDKLVQIYLYYDNIQYIGIDNNIDASISYIKVNDNVIYNSNINYKDNKKFNNDDGFIDLGTFNDEEVQVVISLNKDICINDFQILSLDINKLNNLVTEYKSDVDIVQKDNKLMVNVESESDDKSLFLPLNYLNGYEVTLNGKVVNIDNILNNFVSIDLEEGKNEIILTYYPPYLKICLFISLIFIVMFIIFLKFNIINVNNVILNIFMYSYYFIFLVMFFYVYIYGFFKL